MARKERDDESTGMSGKRNKSWREIDAAKGKSKYHSRQDDPSQQKIERSASYSKYKSAADALFTGGSLPTGLAETFDPDGKRKEQNEALLKVKQSADRKAWVENVVTYLATYPLPEDAYFLDSLLDHPKDRIVDKSLAKLESMADENKFGNKLPPSLMQRLKSLELTSTDPDVQARAKVLREKLFK